MRNPPYSCAKSLKCPAKGKEGRVNSEEKEGVKDMHERRKAEKERRMKAEGKRR
jgi:hypothetical protein